MQSIIASAQTHAHFHAKFVPATVANVHTNDQLHNTAASAVAASELANLLSTDPSQSGKCACFFSCTVVCVTLQKPYRFALC